MIWRCDDEVNLLNSSSNEAMCDATEAESYSAVGLKTITISFKSSHHQIKNPTAFAMGFV